LRELFGPVGPGSTGAGEAVVVLRPAGGMTQVNREPGQGVLETIGAQR
jgi:hypothetical protein